MSQELTVVVTCTDRKSHPAQAHLLLRSVPHGDTKISEWTRRIESTRNSTPLRQLYQGEAWSQLPRLEEAARAAGFQPTLYVASAGLGLRPLSTSAPAYGATFTPSHADSVPGAIAQQRLWWDQLNEWNGSRGELPPTDKVLFVLSRRYADVLAPLVTRTALARSVLVVGGSDAIASPLRLRSDAKLRSTLGGTLGGLNMRIAVAWLRNLTSSDLSSQHDRDRWNDWSARAGRHERYDRTPLSDREVRRYIDMMRAEAPAISKTRALRGLRSSGFACEQHRFAQLFDSALRGES